MQVSVNEALVWRLLDVWNRLDLASLSNAGDDQQVQASTDTPVQISLIYCSDLTAAVRLASYLLNNGLHIHISHACKK